MAFTDTLVSATLPIADDDSHKVTLQGNKAVGPGGEVFATRQPRGFWSGGKTPLGQWLAQTSGQAGLSASVRRVLEAVAANEGTLEAINSYDNAFLSFGLQQWTVGTDSSAGELAVLLERLKQTDRATFDECFGRYGLDVQVPAAAGLRLRYGFLTLRGATVNTLAGKDGLRSAEWAYRFWRAGHFESVRACQAQLAADRIAVALATTLDNQPLSQLVTSEQGVALLLDEHVNRPGHVPATLKQAVAAVIADGAPADAAQWQDEQEAALIRHYIDARNATNMTDPAGRARKIGTFVQQGALSDARNSFRV